MLPLQVPYHVTGRSAPDISAIFGSVSLRRFDHLVKTRNPLKIIFIGVFMILLGRSDVFNFVFFGLILEFSKFLILAVLRHSAIFASRGSMHSAKLVLP